jgi:hypothetical protein
VSAGDLCCIRSRYSQLVVVVGDIVLDDDAPEGVTLPSFCNDYAGSVIVLDLEDISVEEQNDREYKTITGVRQARYLKSLRRGCLVLNENNRVRHATRPSEGEFFMTFVVTPDGMEVEEFSLFSGIMPVSDECESCDSFLDSKVEGQQFGYSLIPLNFQDPACIAQGFARQEGMYIYYQ